MQDSLSGAQLGDYILGEEFAAGGMGSIYRASKPDSKDVFAVKVMLPDFSSDAEFRKRFEREASLLQRLQHPHIVPIYDFGEQNGLLYFVMPYIRGSSLDSLLSKQHFSPATAWMILEPVAKALTYAHSQKVIHRDLKPANILIGSAGSRSLQTHPYLADFGLSKPIDRSTVTQVGTIIGTPQYMAPEQVRAEPVTPRTDVYALGIVVFEMLLGQVPFSEGYPDSIAMAQVQEMPPYPTILHPEFPSDLETVILTALAKDPSDRYESAEGFSSAYWEAMQCLPTDAKMRDYWIV